MNWTYNEDIVDSIDKDIFGFIYIIEYDDGSLYVGKKQTRSCITLPALKNGTVRDNAVRIGKNIKGKRVYFDLLCKESKWKSYDGSCKNVGNRKIVSKKILKFCTDKTNLTYWEVAIQCKLDVLTDDRYLNENIGGVYFRSKIL